MIRISELTKEHYSTGEVSKMLNLNHKTAYFWCRRGTVEFFRLPNGDYAIPKEEVVRLIQERGLAQEEKELKDFFYARVSSKKEEENGLLKEQLDQLNELTHTNYHVQNLETIVDVGSGLDTQRPGLQKLLDLAAQGQVSRIFVLYEDRLSEFDCEYLKWYFQLCQTELIILKKGSSKASKHELLQDLNEILKIVKETTPLTLKEKEGFKRRINQIKVDRSSNHEQFSDASFTPSTFHQEILNDLKSCQPK